MSVQIQRIVTSTDFSDFAVEGVRYAHALAQKFGASMHLVHLAGTKYKLENFVRPAIVDNNGKDVHLHPAAVTGRIDHSLPPARDDIA